MVRVIAHIDLDAFFASIEERDKPRLRGRPIVVGADPLDGRGRGVVSTANYKAREYGIRSAMPISKAWRLSEDARRRGLPPAAFMGVDMERYLAESERVMDVLRKHADVVEVASVDEAFVDLSAAAADVEEGAAPKDAAYGAARAAARSIKDDIRRATGLTASVGIGPNKLIAKIASDREKPDGLTVVREEEAESFLDPLPVSAIPGVGPKSGAILAKLGIGTVRDAKKMPLDGPGGLRVIFGKWGAELYEKLRGRDGDAPLVAERVAKSVGEQRTFASDVPIETAAERRKLTDALARATEDVFTRAAGEGFESFRSIAIVVRFADFTTKTRSVTVEKPVALGREAALLAAGLATAKFQSLRLFMPFLDRRENPKRMAIRLIGVRVEKLA